MFNSKTVWDTSLRGGSQFITAWSDKLPEGWSGGFNASSGATRDAITAIADRQRPSPKRKERLSNRTLRLQTRKAGGHKATSKKGS